ncbi:MAG: GIY-YIG nuclease family protein [Candidatus Sungbacteria bacterium]|uniref:GIY-YIG nuclease family protein n=1 Tax=Candidatus Sungiibacteriota bacterium TaxID=2750080 RepID=A0A9D6LTK8_9BACT|nr:GIY-YIG nuclease family protein [Candidatus Sungbacteria bacterium]
MKYIVYILKSERDGGIYIGHTEDLSLAMAEHEAGAKRGTKYRLPMQLVHKESVKSFKQVKMKEQYWLSREGVKEIETMIGPLPKKKGK